ncbi:MAG: hypothetical protein V2A76_03930 [Planctomycetota bacterium]
MLSNSMLGSLVLSLAVLPAPLPAKDEIAWIGGTYNSALIASEASGKKVLAYCWKENDPDCVSMYDYTFQVEEVVTAMKKWICFSVKEGTPEGDSFIKEQKVRKLPTVLFLTSKGELIDVVGGVVPPKQLVIELERILRGENTLQELLVKADNPKAPDYLEVNFLLSFRFRGLGDKESAEARLAALRVADPKAQSLAGSRAHLIQVLREGAESVNDPSFWMNWDGEALSFRGDVESWPLQRLMDWARKVQNPEGKFEAWDLLAGFQMKMDGRSAAMSSWQQAQKTVPDHRAIQWGADLALQIMGFDGKRTAQDKKFALRLATQSAKLAEDLKEDSKLFQTRFKDKSHNAVIAQYLETLGFAQKYNGQHGQSLATLQRCIDLDPGNEKYTGSFELIKSGVWPPPPREKP